MLGKPSNPHYQLLSGSTISIFLISEIFVLSLFIIVGGISFLPVIIVTILFFVWSVRNPSIWILTVILFHILILERSEGITIWEILFGLYFFGFIGFWFTRKFIEGQKIIKSQTDIYFCLFLSITLFSIIPAVMHNASLLKWFRELILFLSYLMYFPVRDSLSDRKILFSVGVGFLMLASWIAAVNLIRYENAATSAVYAWELLSGRQTANEPLFLTSIIIGSSLFLYSKSKSIKLILLALIVFFSIILLFTFSRGYWIGALFGMMVFFFLVKNQNRIKLFIVAGVLIVAVIGIVYFMFSYLGGTILQTVVERLGSKSLSAYSDPSLYGRLIETQVVLNYILSNPFIGYGLGSLIRFYNPILGYIEETWYIHNGYLFLWFKFGIVGLVLYLLSYGSIMRDAYFIMKKRLNMFEGYLSAGIISLLAAMLPISITSPQFIQRDSILIIGLCWAIISGWRNGIVPYTITSNSA